LLTFSTALEDVTPSMILEALDVTEEKKLEKKISSGDQ
jgi:hypothetical protein